MYQEFLIPSFWESIEAFYYIIYLLFIILFIIILQMD